MHDFGVQNIPVGGTTTISATPLWPEYLLPNILLPFTAFTSNKAKIILSKFQILKKMDRRNNKIIFCSNLEPNAKLQMCEERLL